MLPGDRMQDLKEEENHQNFAGEGLGIKRVII
jgi:hypothetical protein